MNATDSTHSAEPQYVEILTNARNREFERNRKQCTYRSVKLKTTTARLQQIGSEEFQVRRRAMRRAELLSSAAAPPQLVIFGHSQLATCLRACRVFEFAECGLACSVVDSAGS